MKARKRSSQARACQLAAIENRAARAWSGISESQKAQQPGQSVSAAECRAVRSLAGIACLKAQAARSGAIQCQYALKIRLGETVAQLSQDFDKYETAPGLF